MDQPPKDPSKQDRRSTLDAFVRPLKVEEVEAEKVLAGKMSSFGEDEFEARAGLTL